jgi:hypothetical protein
MGMKKSFLKATKAKSTQKGPINQSHVPKSKSKKNTHFLYHPHIDNGSCLNLINTAKKKNLNGFESIFLLFFAE